MSYELYVLTNVPIEADITRLGGEKGGAIKAIVFTWKNICVNSRVVTLSNPCKYLLEYFVLS